MSFGTLYWYPKAPRATMCLYIAEYNKLDVKYVEAWPIKVNASKGGVGEDYLSKFPTGKVPALERPDGFTLFECIPVAVYLAKQDPKTTLLGSSLEEEATILKWASFSNSELLPPIMAWINPVIGKGPSSPEILAAAERNSEAMVGVVEKALTGKKYLVADHLTLADLFVVAAITRGYQFVFAKEWAAKHPAIHEWYMALKSDEIWRKIDGEPYVLDAIPVIVMSITQSSSAFARAEFIPPDSIFDVTRRYVADTYRNKVNLGQGTYRDENGNPWILPSVRLAEDKITNAGHEYLPIAGLKDFRDEAVKLVFHDTDALKEGRVASCQSLSGTGALLLVGLALKKAELGIKTIYITDPTWSNHELLFASQGFTVKSLPYYKNGAFNSEGYLNGLKAMDENSAVILHSCAHNPTGCDPTREEWKKIAAILKEKGTFPVFDSAYLGFNSGNVDEDAWAIKYFVEDAKFEVAVCMSFAKSMGLYGERIGLVAFVTNSPEVTKTVNSILENVQRATVSNPPAHGARIAAAVLGNPETAAQWAKDLKTMSGRILSMRQRLFDELCKLGTPGDWSHITSQSGMFGFLGISAAKVKHLEGTIFEQLLV
ncbi:hypothetical protein G7046_g1244 [Stylonectria norvegica]|nr:hypothetical protein G7046_g1244 [Stylonectria norvegica]